MRHSNCAEYISAVGERKMSKNKVNAPNLLPPSTVTPFKPDVRLQNECCALGAFPREFHLSWPDTELIYSSAFIAIPPT